MTTLVPPIFLNSTDLYASRVKPIFGHQLNAALLASISLSSEVIVRI